MTHLTDEQFEDVVQGLAPEPAHLAECPACRDRLAERRAVRDRLRSAMASVRPDAALAERIRRATETARAVPTAAPAKRLAHRPLPRLAWASLAAAAVILIAVTTILYLTAPNSAQAELVRIHTANLSASPGFYAEADPAKLAEYLKTELGFQPAAPQLGQGMAMRGCCVAHFQGHAVGSYVVKTPRGSLSIIVVPQTPAQLGMDPRVPGRRQGLLVRHLRHQQHGGRPPGRLHVLCRGRGPAGTPHADPPGPGPRRDPVSLRTALRCCYPSPLVGEGRVRGEKRRISNKEHRTPNDEVKGKETESLFTWVLDVGRSLLDIRCFAARHPHPACGHPLPSRERDTTARSHRQILARCQ